MENHVKKSITLKIFELSVVVTHQKFKKLIHQIKQLAWKLEKSIKVKNETLGKKICLSCILRSHRVITTKSMAFLKNFDCREKFAKRAQNDERITEFCSQHYSLMWGTNINSLATVNYAEKGPNH